ncbi:MAG: hypothetical protein KBG29_08620, partial [Pseudomonadales bacterium]|nr:hypothetical protein [Pseudomonadales bacterium]
MVNDNGLLRLPTAAEARTFWHDGVVCLRGVLDPDYVLAMAPAVDRLIRESLGTTMVDLSAMGEELARAGETVLSDARTGGGRFVSGIDHWRVDADCARFACRSAVPAIVARL